VRTFSVWLSVEHDWINKIRNVSSENSREALKNVGGDALARQIFQKKRTTARMQEVEQRRSSCRVYT
jgi:hypothetical protein